MHKQGGPLLLLLLPFNKIWREGIRSRRKESGRERERERAPFGLSLSLLHLPSFIDFALPFPLYTLRLPNVPKKERKREREN